MNKLSIEKQTQVINALVEGCSIRSTERLTGVHRDTIMRLLCRVGNACQELMDSKMRNLPCQVMQVDEIWTFVGKKQRRLTPADDNQSMGDQYVFVALDADTKLIPTYTVGKRDTRTTFEFIFDLQERLTERIQITSDGYRPYWDAIEQAFGTDVDFASLIKTFAASNPGPGRYAPPKVSGVIPSVHSGRPDLEKISTSFVERQNLTMRMQMRRLTRLTNAYSKKLDNLKAALALHFAWYNFVRIHHTLRVTPAMAANVTDRLWSLEEFVRMAN
jgi:IS1 family transposase